jgi:putative ABC transport system ATP-binding protein
MMIPILCQNIHCRRPDWNGRPQGVVEGFSGRFEAGTSTAFRGAGDSGIGLLLNILGMIERPDSGDLRVLGQTVLDLEAAAACRLRDRAFGYLFTHPHLLPSFTVAENIAMPFLRLCGDSEKCARDRVVEVLAFAGLDGSVAARDIRELDSESRWRVAFARSIVHRPEILVAVSPPAPFLLPLATRYSREEGACVLWNAGGHDPAGQCDRVLEPESPSGAVRAG